MSVIDTPDRFGRWTVVSKDGPLRKNGRTWIVRCSCGEERPVVAKDLLKGKSKSCGCLCKEMTGARAKIVNRTHGLHDSDEFRIWIDMRRRCYEEHRPDYKNYGGRGIRICDEWRYSFQTFYADMGERPARNYSLDRFPNADGNYEPGNVRWAARKDQERNKRSNRILTIHGEQMTMVEASERFHIHYHTLASRLARGWDELAAVERPLRVMKPCR